MLREALQYRLLASEMAYVVATTGDLAGALRSDELDDDLYLATGQNICDLIDARPYESCEDLDDYEDRWDAIGLYLSQVSRKEKRLEAFSYVSAILDYLESDATGAGSSRTDKQ